MAKGKSYDTNDVMKEREQYTDPTPKKRPTGQDLQGRSNGKKIPGGPRSKGQSGKKCR